MAGKLIRPTQRALLGPTVMETGPDSQWLYPCAVAERGAVVRISVFSGMYVGQEITLVWEGKTVYRIKTSVVDVEHCIDLILPRKVLLDNVIPDGSGVCDVYYEVKVGDILQRSSVTQVYIPDRLVSNPPVTVPEAVGGEFNPDEVPKPGLKIEFPRRVDWAARWSSYAPDGSLIATVSFAVHEHEEFVYMWRYMLDQTEPGGDVWINYHAANDTGLLVDSLYTVLRVVNSQSRSGKPFGLPAITGVVDSKGKPIPHNGTTEDTVLTLSGIGVTDTVVIIEDNNTPVALARVDENEEWMASVAVLPGRHSYTVAQSQAWVITVIVAGEDFETGAVGVIPANTAREFPAMFVTPKDKDASLIIDSIGAPFVTGKAISFADQSSAHFLFKSPVNKVTFGAFAMASAPDVVPPILSCFDEQGGLIFERKLDFGFDFSAWHAAVSPDRKIKAIELTVNPGTSAFVVDNFTFA